MGHRRAMLAVSLLVLAAVLVPTASGQQAQAVRVSGHRGNAASQSLPVGYDKYLVFVANGSWNIAEPHPTVPSCGVQFLFCDGMYFQEQIMQRTADEITAKEQEAIEHFKEQFGIDVRDPANEDRLEFSPLMADPRWNYRVYSWGGRAVPPEGYEIRDGGWGVIITDPDGYTLGGEHEGVHVPAGSLAIYGEYNIRVTKPTGKRQPVLSADRHQRVEEVVLSYRPDTFMTFNQFGDMAFSCQLSDDQFASGQTMGFGQGFVNVGIDSSGTLNLNIRNVLTFGPHAEVRR